MCQGRYYHKIEQSKLVRVNKLITRPLVRQVSLTSIIKTFNISKKDFTSCFKSSEHDDLKRAFKGEINFSKTWWPTLCQVLNASPLLHQMSAYKLVRVIYGYSHEEIAALLDVKRSTYTAIENERHQPSGDFVLKFLVCFNIEPKFMPLFKNY